MLAPKTLDIVECTRRPNVLIRELAGVLLSDATVRDSVYRYRQSSYQVLARSLGKFDFRREEYFDQYGSRVDSSRFQ